MKTKNKSRKTAKKSTKSRTPAAKKTAKKTSKKTTAKKAEKKVPAKRVTPSRATQAQKFPGYPPYNPADDITKKGKRIDADIEDTTLENNRTDAKITNDESKKITNQSNAIESDEESEISTDPYAVTKEDLAVLGSDNLASDDGEDDGLKNRVTPVDFAGEDLDVPGSELDDSSESVGSEDEENNSYSLGGDSHNDLEEDQA